MQSCLVSIGEGRFDNIFENDYLDFLRTFLLFLWYWCSCNQNCEVHVLTCKKCKIVLQKVFFANKHIFSLSFQWLILTRKLHFIRFVLINTELYINLLMTKRQPNSPLQWNVSHYWYYHIGHLNTNQPLIPSLSHYHDMPMNNSVSRIDYNSCMDITNVLFCCIVIYYYVHRIRLQRLKSFQN